MTLKDAEARRRIGEDTDETLFVNAGAGSGKTTALVDRIATLVLVDGVPMAAIAAVTFTDKAGAELRDRLRARFERSWHTDPRAEQALNDLDAAAVGTLHSFAQRLLAEHPIEAGLPPIVEVLDEVGSSVAFEQRWGELRTALLDDDGIARPLLLALANDLTLAQLRTLAQLLGKDWDLIDERVLRTTPVAEVRLRGIEDFVRRAREVVELGAHCCDGTDKLLPWLHALPARLDLLADAADDEAALAVLRGIRAPRGRLGAKPNWLVPVETIRAACIEVSDAAKALVDDVTSQCLRQITRWLGVRVLAAADARRRDGKLEFHDLLVLARDVLRRDAVVRQAAHQDYRRILLDEFQDTDPIQIELAVRICGGAGASAPDWQDVAVPPGRLFVVGDAKQSIYRFRRASIETYLRAGDRIGDQVTLTANFRAVEPIVDWVNAVFTQLIVPKPDSQPLYVPLDVVREGTGSGAAVTVLGAEAHADLPRAHAALLREREARDVAAAVRRALGEQWQVQDERSGTWRPARPEDIAILVPARTSLPFLEDALDRAGIPYQAEASSLVYQAAEVRDLLACARAVADPSDSLSLVTALRSPAFGCGDDDLWVWRRDGGRFSILAPSDTRDGPVATGIAYLRRLHRAARWMAPADVLAAIVTERRMYEIAATGPRARDGWRRLRFVVDQARAWSEVSHGGLRAYLAWAGHQGEEVARVAESVLPETDANSVRVMTVHAAKGLEFPIVVLSGMTAQARPNYGVSLLWRGTGGYSVHLSKSVQTVDFALEAPVDEQMDDDERRRLLYVAATRARDHLVVSLHRAVGSTRSAAALIADAGGVAAGRAVAFTPGGTALPAAPPARVPQPPDLAEWSVRVEAARARSRAVPALTASGLEGTEPDVVLDASHDAGSAKGPRDLELPPWTKGRYGSAVGRAVHAVLQSVDLASGAGLAAAVAAQAVAEGVAGQERLIRALAESALGSDIVARAAAREHWRETYVGTRRADGTVLEGYVDLVYRDDDGTLVIVDYKTDAVPADAIPSRVAYYAPQLAAYREALGAATGAATAASLLFLTPSEAVPVAVVPLP